MTHKRIFQLSSVIAVLAGTWLCAVGCGDPSPSSPMVPSAASSPSRSYTAKPGSSPAQAPTSTTATRNVSTKPDEGPPIISGRVVRSTGEPYPGVIVEFKNINGGNVHTETDRHGSYQVQAPPGVYTALAMDFDDYNAGFEVIGRRDNAVSVPPSTVVDFKSYAIVER
jgi:hypothetical protein